MKEETALMMFKFASKWLFIDNF